MKNNKQELKIALGYMLIMAVGMTVAYHVFGYSYSDIRLVKVLVIFEAAMTAYAFAFYRKMYSGTGFKKIRLNPVLIYYALMMSAVFLFYIIDRYYLENRELMVTIVIATVFIAVSEELIYRGIVLNGYLRNNSVIKSVFCSAVLFSLLHSVNIFAGFGVISVLTQLVNTFIHGMAMGCMMVKTKNLIPFMAFHFIWDLVMLSSSAFANENAIIVMLALVSDLVIATVMISSFKKKNLV